MKTKRPVIGITLGDPVGIGPEIVVSALEDPNIYSLCKPLVLGDTTIVTQALALKKSRLALIKLNQPEDGAYTHGTIDHLALSDLSGEPVLPGRPTVKTGQAMLDYITTAVDLSLEGRLAAMVTCPITKTALKLTKTPFHGHTELIAHRTGSRDYAMMLAGDRLKVVLVTIHIPLSRVPEALTTKNILKTIRITANALTTRFGITSPKIAVAGLNPHAGEEALFGTEEIQLITPAVDQANLEGITAIGPIPPDTLFYHAAKGNYDAVVSMYHDQGLIPFKMIHFEDGVNTTLGLPIIRTSVDHGTAYDIAWKGIAGHTSLTAAIKMAAYQAGAGILS